MARKAFRSDGLLFATAALSALTGAIALLGRDRVDRGSLALGFGLALLYAALAAFLGAMVKRKRIGNTAAQWIAVAGAVVLIAGSLIYGELRSG